MKPHANDLVLGIDGGGTKTVAWLALRDVVEGSGRDAGVIGRGAAGPSNMHAVGWETAQRNLATAIQAAFADANVEPGETAAMCAAIAGSGRAAERTQLEQWAREQRIAERIDIVADALPILAIAAPHGAGAALIAGTGSFAFGRNAAGQTARAGGWGYLLGDEGSAFDVAREALAAVARAADGRGAPTALTAAILERRSLREPADLINSLYGAVDVRAEIAALADVVTAAAGRGDAVALNILQSAADSLASLVIAVAIKLQIASNPFSLGMAGGMLVHTAELRERLLAKLKADGIALAAVSVVDQPVAGAVMLARQLSQA